MRIGEIASGEISNRRKFETTEFEFPNSRTTNIQNVENVEFIKARDQKVVRAKQRMTKMQNGQNSDHAKNRTIKIANR